MGVDETSLQKRHEYVTIVTDQEKGRVLHVADDRKTESLGSFFEGLDQAQRERIELVAVDMHCPQVKAGAMHVPGFASKLCFAKYHWIRNPKSLPRKLLRELNGLVESSLPVGPNPSRS